MRRASNGICCTLSAGKCYASIPPSHGHGDRNRTKHRVTHEIPRGNVGLRYNTGHLVFDEADHLQVLRQHGARINRVYTQDVRKTVMDELDPDYAAVTTGVSTVPGDGLIIFAYISAQLVGRGPTTAKTTCRPFCFCW